MSGVRLACVIPAGIREQYAAGNWKDIAALNALLDAEGMPYREISQSDGNAGDVMQACADGVTDILVHYSFWPDMIRSVRKAYPTVRIHTRIHNAEALQHLHRRAPGFMPSMANLRSWYGAVNLFLQDARCRRLSDNFLCISDWDMRHYQRFLPGSAALLDAPYHCPWPVLRPQVIPQQWDLRRDALVCLAGGRDRLGLSQRDNLVSFATALRRSGIGAQWNFEISSGVHRKSPLDAELGPVSAIGDVAQPWDLLCSVKAMALLTPLGFGCKTTIVDALTAGCNVLVHSGLAARLPEEVRRLCVLLDPDKPGTFADAFAALGRAPARTDLNDRLAGRARTALIAALGSPARKGGDA